MTYISTKRYDNLPCCHRQPKHQGHCAYIHGYSREFTFQFAARELNENHFVMDFGELKDLKEWLDYMFDHTLLINEDDPERELFEEMHSKGLCDLRIMPNVSMEATAKYVFQYVDKLVKDKTKKRCWCVQVECRENSKNSAIYQAENLNTLKPI
ncbi:MAG: 6-carboxytetrahydropterin synthase [Lentisphaeria bacterium]|nr:6-carboxytetrahydropterin synthase [Lentisphaeria bacterium]NQZ68569.1 6-carboxytetrahydropterin synthase [Lentisphaeria bacterium]